MANEENRQRESNLVKVSKGIAKGLGSAVCTATFVGLPAADGLANSTREGPERNAYNTVMLSAIALTCYSLGYLLSSNISR